MHTSALHESIRAQKGPLLCVIPSKHPVLLVTLVVYHVLCVHITPLAHHVQREDTQACIHHVL